MSRLDDIKVKHKLTGVLSCSSDVTWLIDVAEAARLPPDHDIDDLKWCQRFIMNLQIKLSGVTTEMVDKYFVPNDLNY